ncbi:MULTISPECIES: aldolase/citrate lyase family protein [unclassified Spirosoma]|uniref:HpcH/HpaI aldolase family protein n=1 Tax=unclassified Spirosoma TaxID=2621999 RepID=UPI0009641EFB|nr:MULTISPECIES: aldolase/citrate lyase family protein [unclassified Spirosoma]MBN8827030.1 hypothetical protein [Spirosoma sp.]OJW74425.1 MAG: hypothetical protein BGO59_19565 [Spirosoma sp. 48-14]
MDYKLGMWLSIGSPIITELASLCDFDWLLLDLEHGCLSDGVILANLQAVRPASATALIIRIGSLDKALISRVLDWGASGIMLPHVSSAEEATACVAVMRYPPHGNRGYSSSVRAYQYGLEPPVDLSVVEPARLFVQIEDLEGVIQSEAIAQVDGVDILFVGPADLKLDLSTRPLAMDYSEALQQVSNSARKCQKQAGIMVRNPNDIPALVEMGYSCFAMGSDLAILREGFQSVTNRKPLIKFD